MLKQVPFHKGFLITLLTILIASSLFSQSFNRTSYFKPYWQLGVSGGTSLFFGDIKQYQWAPVSNYNNEWRAGGSLMLGVQPSPVFGIRGQFLIGQLSGTRREWNKYFTTDYFDLTLNATISLRNIVSRYKPDQFWNAYVIMGIGLINYDTEVKDLKTNKVLQRVGFGNGSGINGSTLEGILSGGLGLDFRLNKNFNLNLETSNRIMNSDMLDGRESGFKYDVYNYTSLGISYRFGSQKNHRKSENYRYSEQEKKTPPPAKEGGVKEAEFDYVIERPVEPPEIDMLVIEKTEPVTIVEETVVEPVVIVKEEQKTIQQGIEYRVQILAKYGTPISVQKISDKYNIPASEISEDIHNGFYIYTTGSYTTYELARERRNEIRLNNGIKDAFVVAFENGKRLNKLP